MTEVSGLSELLAMPVPRPLTVDDLFRLPDDGWRYELVDGSLVTSPPPTMRHDTVNNELLAVVMAAARPRWKVRNPDIGILLDDGTYVVPDLVVLAPDADLSGKGFLPRDVVLVVEVVSPSNASQDLVLKRHVYAEHGIPHYWIVDSRGDLRITVLGLDGSGRSYVAGHDVGPDESVRLADPFPVTLTPRELLG